MCRDYHSILNVLPIHYGPPLCGDGPSNSVTSVAVLAQVIWMRKIEKCVYNFHGSGARVTEQSVAHVRNAPVIVCVCVVGR